MPQDTGDARIKGALQQFIRAVYRLLGAVHWADLKESDFNHSYLSSFLPQSDDLDFNNQVHFFNRDHVGSNEPSLIQ